jgi:UDP-sulfoquinovose synthase
LNIKDTLNCVRLSLEQSPDAGELRIFNQFVETFSVNELAERVQGVGNQFGLNVRIRSVENPRKEAEEHYYNPTHTGLLELGLKPHYLTDGVLAQMIEAVLRHKSNIHEHMIYRKVKWS